MLSFISSSTFTLFWLPLLCTALVAGIITYVSRGTSKMTLLSAATGITISWVCASVIGVPDFPPETGINSVPYLILIGLLSGSLLDHLLPWLTYKHKFTQLLLDLSFVAPVIFWFTGKVNLESALILFVWAMILFRSRRVSANPRMPGTLLILAAAGLASISWIGGAYMERDIALGIISAGLGISIWFWLKKDAPVGFSFFWSSFTALLLIALSIIDANTLMTIPIILLGFIFFADTMLSRTESRITSLKHVTAPVTISMLSLIPIVLASAAALVADGLFRN